MRNDRARREGGLPSARKQAIAAAIIIAACLAIGGLGGLATSGSVSSWFPTLVKPAWNPPNWVFGPVWTTLYIMMAIAYWLVWRRAGFANARRATALFASQLALNLGWSLLFFGLKMPLPALIEIVVLWVAIAATALEFRRHSKTATLLLLPYLLWVSYATSLNAGIVWLNN